jgi:hypothetical protein
MNREFAQLVSIRSLGRKSRWYGPGLSVCFTRLGMGAASQKQPINWDKVLGLATALLVVALGWTAAGFAISRFIR